MQTVQTHDTVMPGATSAANPATAALVPEKKKNSKVRAAIIGVSVVAAGVCGYYFLWPLFRRKGTSNNSSVAPQATSNTSTQTNSYTPSQTSTAPAKSVTPARNDNFPLKQGSKGPNVTMLQNALIARYGKSILPKYGADGDFGAETVAALKSRGLSTPVDQATFISLTEGTKIDPVQYAKNIAAAVLLGFDKVLPLLQKIKTAQQYKDVSNQFKEIRIGLIRYQSLLSAMFRLYTESGQQSQLRKAFTNMGLIYKPDEDTWKLPDNLSGFELITTQITHVWPDPQTAVQVPPNMVLGQEIGRQDDFVAFENGGRRFLVPAAHVRYT
ncbi:MAG TPA: hypothetical protein VD905_19665 [Flavobacteriales bacterium]|nr:hypothetical protein [Flavobacteriales bacterium]